MMADSLTLILQVFPVPGDDAGELAEWLRGELPNLQVQEVERLLGTDVSTGATGSADIARLFLVQLDPMALQVVLAKVTDWATRSDRLVEIGAGGHMLTLSRLTRQRRETVIDDPHIAGVEVSRVQPEGETETFIEAPLSVVPNHDSSAPQPGKELAPLSPRESVPVVRWSLRGRGDASGRNWLGDASLLVKGSIDIEPLPTQEFRRVAAFTGILVLLASGFIVLLSIAILTITRHYHRFSISSSYPVHRIYQGLMRYFTRITPPPGSAHIILVYTVYLAVIPVLFAVVFMYLKVGSARLIVAVVACVIFMAAPFIIVVTSIRTGSTNCGSWNYPEPNSGAECYGILTDAFRIAFAVGILGLIVPVVYLIRGRRHKSSLLRALIACAGVVVAVFRFINGLARGEARRGRDATAEQEPVVGANKYLLPHERQVIIVRSHPAVLIGPAVLTLAEPVAAGVLTATVLNGHGTLVTALWVAWLFLLLWMIWKAVSWVGTFFVVTSQRLLLVSGVLAKKVVMMPLSKVTDMSFRRSFTGRLLGYGEFIIESADRDQALKAVDHIPYPEQLYLEVCGLIFKDPAARDD